MILPTVSPFVLPHTIEILAKTVVKGTAGGRSEEWRPVLQGQPACIQPLSQADQAASQQRDGQRVTHRIYLGVIPIRITTQHRIKFGSRVFSVVSALDQCEAGRLWKLEAEETQ